MSKLRRLEKKESSKRTVLLQLADRTRLLPQLLSIIRAYTELEPLYRVIKEGRFRRDDDEDTEAFVAAVGYGLGSCTFAVCVKTDSNPGKIFVEGYWWVDEHTIHKLLRNPQRWTSTADELSPWPDAKFKCMLNKLIEQSRVIRLIRFAF